MRIERKSLSEPPPLIENAELIRNCRSDGEIALLLRLEDQKQGNP